MEVNLVRGVYPKLDEKGAFDGLWQRMPVDLDLVTALGLFTHGADLVEEMTARRYVH